MRRTPRIGLVLALLAFAAGTTLAQSQNVTDSGIKRDGVDPNLVARGTYAPQARPPAAKTKGVATTGQGSASYHFDDASGNYDVRISYFDAKDGQSKVQLWVGTKEVLNFKLDEDVNCWRWRRFKNIPVQRGDEIKLVAAADGKEPARLDFIEFIPVKR